MSVLGERYGDIDGHDEHETSGRVIGAAEVNAVLGALAEVIGRRHGRPRHAELPPMADWRRGQLAHGVHMPDEGMHPLPLTPQQNSGLFANSTNGGPTMITYQGQLQKPFRGERMFVNPSRSGTTAVTGALTAQFFVGVDLQQAEIFGVDIETIGAGGTFGSRMTFMQAEPGILIRALVTENTIPTAPDFIKLNVVTLMGRIIH
jgi:hypothetical protein